MLATGSLVVAVLSSGCGDQDAVDYGGKLVTHDGRIAFTRATSFAAPKFDSEVYTVGMDGSGERRLTDRPGLDAFPAWSPDGERIAFTSDHDGNWEIYVMDPHGARQRRLTHTPEDESGPAWSPDGEKIAYVTDVFEDDPSIHVMNSDGSGTKRLADGNWPSWSPDGERIVYTDTTYPGTPHLAVMSAAGSGQRRLGGSLLQRLTGTGYAEEPAWSPDGARIAFVSTPGVGNADNAEIYVMNSDGTGLIKLTNNPAEDLFPAWRP